MTGALILLGVLCLTGIVLWLLHRPDDPSLTPPAEPGPEAEAGPEECCGMHITCEKDSLSPGVGDQQLYYDDEELDAFRGRTADSYTPAEADLFRDVLLTLRPEEIAGWARSTQLRGITLPADVRDELLLIVAEARAARTNPQNPQMP